MAKLPTRPELHVKDTRGFKRLLDFFGSEWIIRTITPDYGIDYEIEPWKNSQPVNKLIKVQVKNNDSIHEAHDPINVYPFKVSTLNYLDRFENTFILSLTYDNIFVFNSKAISTVFNINQESDSCSIPLVYKRKFYSNQYEQWIDNSRHRILFSTLGKTLALDELENTSKKREDFENYYLTNVKDCSEADFFEREELANYGFYCSTLKRNQQKAVQKLIRFIPNASSLKIRGIIEGLAHLNFKNETTEKIAFEMLKSDNTQDILVALMHLSVPGDNRFLDTYLKAIYGYFDYRKCIIEDEETHGIELTGINALFNINTDESLALIVEMFLSDAFKPTEVKFIHSLFTSCNLATKTQLLGLINKQSKSDYNMQEYENIMANYIETKMKFDK